MLSTIAITTYSTTSSWGAPLTAPRNQTVPSPDTYLPTITAFYIRDCTPERDLHICNLTSRYENFSNNYAWSPDGNTFVYAHISQNTDSNEEDDVSGLYEISANGEARRLLLEMNNIYSLRYSPDGTMIALVVGLSVNDGQRTVYDIYIYTLATGEARPLVNISSRDYSYILPEWSPDSSKLVFVRYSHNTITSDIYAILADGSELTQLTDTPLSEYSPLYSPDGTRIVYIVYNHITPEPYIAVIEADGNNPTDLTNWRLDYAIYPAWTADSKSIFFFGATENRDMDIYRINIDGSGFTNLTSDTLNQHEPILSPDRSKILFAGQTDLNSDNPDIALYTMDTDGGSLIKLASPHVTGRYNTRTIQWHPDGEHISYVVATHQGNNLFLMRIKP